MEKTAAEKLFNLYVSELIERGLIDPDLADTGNYVFVQDEVDGNELNRAESDAVNRYKQEFAWLYGPLTDEAWGEFKEKCWREGL